MNTWLDWYNQLSKPALTPSPTTIALVWSILYPIIFVSFGWVFYQGYRQRFPKSALLPFYINLVANFAFVPVLFGIRSLLGAGVVIFIVWISIVWAIKVIWPYSKLIALLQLPYLVWVSIATCLQWLIIFMNH